MDSLAGRDAERCRGRMVRVEARTRRQERVGGFTGWMMANHSLTQSHRVTANPIVSHPLSSSLSSFLSHPHTVPSQHSTWLKRSKVKNSKAKIHLHPDCLHQLLSISHTLHTLHPSDVRLCPWTSHLTPHPSHLTLRLYTSPFTPLFIRHVNPLNLIDPADREGEVS